MTKKLTTIVVAIAGVLALPATGQASDTFGSLLKNGPANGPDPCVEGMPGPCTLVGYIHPNDAGDPVTSPAPYDGVVTKVRIRSAAADEVTFRFASISAPQGEVANARIRANGPTVELKGTGEIEEYAARVSVKKGWQVALDAPSASAVYNQGGDKFTYLYAPPLVLGAAPLASSGEPTGQLLVQAVIERDANGNGYGDETQEPADRRKPKVGGIRLTKWAFAKKTTLVYSLTEPAKVTVRIQKQTRKHRYVWLHGKLTDTGIAGENKLTIKRRFAGHKLAPGAYRLVVVAKDAAGNKSLVKRVGFGVKG
jgi:hypothetical protein